MGSEMCIRDRLEGDTIIVNFTEKMIVPSDLGSGTETPELEVEDIIAIGSARSLYRLPPNDSLAVPGVDPPAVHYVVGNQIRIEMRGQQVESMQVSGQTEGVHLEPLQRAPVPDTAQVDTLAVSDSSAVELELDSELMGPQSIFDYVPPSESLQLRGPFAHPLQNRPRSLPCIH